MCQAAPGTWLIRDEGRDRVGWASSLGAGGSVGRLWIVWDGEPTISASQGTSSAAPTSPTAPDRTGRMQQPACRLTWSHTPDTLLGHTIGFGLHGMDASKGTLRAAPCVVGGDDLRATAHRPGRTPLTIRPAPAGTLCRRQGRRNEPADIACMQTTRGPARGPGTCACLVHPCVPFAVDHWHEPGIQLHGTMCRNGLLVWYGRPHGTLPLTFLASAPTNIS